MPQQGVNKSTQLVAAMDPASNSGKAKAHQYGIAIVATDDLIQAQPGAELVAYGGQSPALKIVTCPDCHATRSIAATTTTRSVQRCDTCTTAEAPRPARRKPTPARGNVGAPIDRVADVPHLQPSMAPRNHTGRKPQGSAARSGDRLVG